MKAPFLKFVAEGRVVRRPGELSRYTFQEICEKIYISFLSLSLLKRFSQTSRWARQYGRETMTYGGFDKVRYSANDLHNMLAVVDGDPAIALKLSNSNAAQALRQRQSVPTLIVKRYLRMMQDDYGFLTAILVPIIIRQAVKHSTESIPTTVTNLITMGFSAMLFAPALIGFIAETYSLTINMYALCIIVFFAGNIFLRKFR